MSETAIKKEKSVDKPVLIASLNVVSVNRNAKDITLWRNAHISAESIHTPNRTNLYDIYSDVELDGHLTGLVQKRIDAVLNKTLFYEKGGVKVDAIDENIETETFRKLVAEIMMRKFWGVMGVEFIPGAELKLVEIPKKHIKPKWRIISKDQSSIEGYKYDDIWNLFVLGEENELGLYLKCAPYVIWKKNGFGDWAQYIEIFGQPVRIIRYDANDIKTQEELAKVAYEAGSSLVMLIPKQAEFEMLDGKASNGNGELQEKFKNACNQELSIIVLGNTETTSSSSSSGYAQSKEHSKQQLEITKSDLKYVANCLNDKKLLNILKSYGWPVGDGGKFKFEKEVDLEELKSRKDIDLAISAKVPIDDDYWYKTYGIPKPDNYDELKSEMEAKEMMKLMPKGFDDESPQKPKSKQAKKPSNLSGWRKIRETLADFFDPAP